MQDIRRFYDQTRSSDHKASLKPHPKVPCSYQSSFPEISDSNIWKTAHQTENLLVKSPPSQAKIPDQKLSESENSFLFRNKDDTALRPVPQLLFHLFPCNIKYDFHFVKRDLRNQVLYNHHPVPRTAIFLPEDKYGFRVTLPDAVVPKDASVCPVHRKAPHPQREDRALRHTYSQSKILLSYSAESE